MTTFVFSSALYASEVWDTKQAHKRSFDVIAKAASRSVLGVHRYDVSSDALFIDAVLIPPSVLLDAAKL